LKDIDPRFIQRVNNTTPVADYSRNGGGSFFGATSSTPIFETRRTFSPTTRPATTSYPTEEAARPRTPMDLHNPRKVAMRQTALDTPVSLTYGGKEIVQGTRIVHDRFGQGTVKELSGRDGDARIVVTFDTMGDKTLLLKFVKLTVID
jgi:DNA helicase-2/ATP-dependent DNA helicase PcrA